MEQKNYRQKEARSFGDDLSMTFRHNTKQTYIPKETTHTHKRTLLRQPTTKVWIGNYIERRRLKAKKSCGFDILSISCVLLMSILVQPIK